MWKLSYIRAVSGKHRKTSPIYLQVGATQEHKAVGMCIIKDLEFMFPLFGSKRGGEGEIEEALADNVTAPVISKPSVSCSFVYKRTTAVYVKL